MPGHSKPPLQVSDRVTVLGGGIIGLSCACATARRPSGHDRRSCTSRSRCVLRLRRRDRRHMGQTTGVTWHRPPPTPMDSRSARPCGRSVAIPAATDSVVHPDETTQHCIGDRSDFCGIGIVDGESWAAWARTLTDTETHQLVRHDGSLSPVPQPEFHGVRSCPVGSQEVPRVLVGDLRRGRPQTNGTGPLRRLRVRSSEAVGKVV